MNVWQTLPCLLLAVAPSSPLLAQDAPATASSSSYFLQSFAPASGGRATSATHVLRAALGDATGTTTSGNHRVDAGFPGGLDFDTTGQPWLSAVLPRFTALRSGATVSLHGSAFNQSALHSVKIGGQTVTTVQSKTNDKLVVTMPNQSVPGWQPIEVVTAGGSTVLAEGIGILPMLYSERAAASRIPFDITFKGNQGDIVAWFLATGPFAPIPIGGFGYGLALDPTQLFVMPAFGIASPSGEFRFDFPPTTYTTSTIFVQALFLSSNQSYAPGAFSNVMRI